jgi:hypothetical protein
MGNMRGAGNVDGPSDRKILNLLSAEYKRAALWASGTDCSDRTIPARVLNRGNCELRVLEKGQRARESAILAQQSAILEVC